MNAYPARTVVRSLFNLKNASDSRGLLFNQKLNPFITYSLSLSSKSLEIGSLETLEFVSMSKDDLLMIKTIMLQECYTMKPTGLLFITQYSLKFMANV